MRFQHLTKNKDYDVCDSAISLDGGMYDEVEKAALLNPDGIAIRFMGKSISFKELIENIDKVANSLLQCEVKQGDYVTIACPNCPSAVYMIYAVNKIGAICNMIHPLSAPTEIKYFLNFVNSNTIVIIDQFFHKFEQIAKETQVKHAIVVDISNDLDMIKKAGYKLTTINKIHKINYSDSVWEWNSFIDCGKKYKEDHIDHSYSKILADDVAAILYSGGTTDNPKGIALTNHNFNSLKDSILKTDERFNTEPMRMLSIMPIFHGFGLAVCIHSVLCNSSTVVLVPRFSPETFEKILYKEKCNYAAGVPALFEEWMKLDGVSHHDYSFLNAVYCGGDKLLHEQKVRIEKFLKLHNSDVVIQEGYGLTETVTCCCLTPVNCDINSTIGKPLPGTLMKIVDKDTLEEKENLQDGEIVISGPLVMKKYINNSEETSKSLRLHSDGKIWLHTGDIGHKDNDGYIYFIGRYKRVIVTSGYTVYPNLLEEVIEKHEDVFRCCVIGVNDNVRGKKLVAIIQLNKGLSLSDDIKASIGDYCKTNIGKYQMPKEFRFIDDMPLTKIGKINYRKLENQ